MKVVMNQKTKTFFIGGLGSNYYYAKDFIKEVNENIIFLNPYIENFKNKQDLLCWFENEIKEEDILKVIEERLAK